MLHNLAALGEEYSKRFESISSWPEFQINNRTKEALLRLPMVESIEASSIRSKIDSDVHCYLPSQYLLYAVFIKDYALSLYEYIKVLDELKKASPSNKVVAEILLKKDVSPTAISKLDATESSWFFDLFNGGDQALDAKTIINKDALRGVKDFFSSVILKIVNVPQVSSESLGRLIYELSENESVYKILEDECGIHLPKLLTSRAIAQFVASTLRHCWNHDSLSSLRKSFKINPDQRFISIEFNELKLTSIFQVSPTRLSKETLTSGEKLRFLEDPIFQLDGDFYYISTEWTHDKDSRLDFAAFQSILEECYPYIQTEYKDGEYVLTLRRFNAATGSIVLPKPFLLLAGISGTGKSRFVRIQAEKGTALKRYQLIPVRPDWHEPSDLLGYVSRIPETKYVPTTFLVFLANAWKVAFDSVIDSELTLKPLDQIPTFWVCLDEMNLAPVEQYFSDYLSVIETRKWIGDKYSCDPIVRPSELLKGEDEALKSMKSTLGLDGYDDLWNFFLEAGIPLPPNLVVAGTVNMDETTHGFSRKVIDRALTFDFGNFFPNDFDKYFGGQNQPKSLAFSQYSHASLSDLKALVPADDDGAKSTQFLNVINAILKDTPFELAYRALNELLVSLLCFKPKDDKELLAVWDDFLMCKLLPRLEGDEDKFRKNGIDVLDELLKLVQSKFPDELGNATPRPDLLNTAHDGKELLIAYRSPAKLQWMKNRLNGGFTSFWP